MRYVQRQSQIKSERKRKVLGREEGVAVFYPEAMAEGNV